MIGADGDARLALADRALGALQRRELVAFDVELEEGRAVRQLGVELDHLHLAVAAILHDARPFAAAVLERDRAIFATCRLLQQRDVLEERQIAITPEALG